MVRLPQEFEMTPGCSYVNEQEPEKAPWAQPIFQAARERLENHLATGGSPEKAESPECYRFEMRRHNFDITVRMSEEGWTQWHCVVQTKSKEECSSLGVKYRKFRYAVHYWVSPDGGTLTWGKFSTQGKHIP